MWSVLMTSSASGTPAQNRCLVRIEQVGERPDGHCDMRSSRIITDYRLSRNGAFPLVKCTR